VGQGDDVVKLEAVKMELAGVFRCIDFDRIVKGVDERRFAEGSLLAAGCMWDLDSDDSVLRIMFRRCDNERMAGGEVACFLIVKDGRACGRESLREGESVS